MPKFRPDLPASRPRPMTLPEAILHLSTGLRDELHHVAQALQSLGSGSTGVTVTQFNQGIQTIMSAFTEAKARFDAYMARHDAAVDGIAADVSALKDEIAKLQATGPGWTPEDQVALDAMEAQVAAATAKLEALDAMTPVVPPVEPPVDPTA